MKNRFQAISANISNYGKWTNFLNFVRLTPQSRMLDVLQVRDC